MPDTATMEAIVSLCKRRGFIFPASEIYGGLNGFWDYGPLGTALKNNVRDAWWHDMVDCPPDGPDGQPVSIVGLDSSIIQNPRVWEASGHVGGFNDPMVDCRESKARYRADHLGFLARKGDTTGQIFAFVSGDDSSISKARKKLEKYVKAKLSDDELDFCGIESITTAELAITVGPDAITGPGAIRHRPNRQSIPQRSDPTELYFPLSRI